MNDVFNEILKNKVRLFVAVITTVFIFIVPFYPDWFTKLPFWIQIIIVLVVAVANLTLGNFPDVVRLALQHRDLQHRFGDLQSEFRTITKAKDEELTELKDVIVTFLEYSHTYKDKILRLLRIQGEYLCIAKSSEGLSDVFNKLKDKEQLPFSKILTDWPGAIKPFENMNLFLLPVSQLRGFNQNKIREWIETNIIPLVDQERTRFLASLPKRISSLADDFSYKYLAFIIHSNSIEYETRNRKFHRSFINTIIVTQSQSNVAHMTQTLTDIIRTKDFFNIVDWSAFIKLNSDQIELFRKNHQRLSDELNHHSLSTLSDIARCDKSTLITIYRNAFKSSITEKRATNLASKTLDGVGRILTILRKHGIQI